LSGASTTTCA